MGKIVKVEAVEILDSRGNPTLEVHLWSERNHAYASVPAGKSRGTHEACEKRDRDRFLGKGVRCCVEIIKKEIEPAIVGMDTGYQEKLDKMLIEMDGTKNKERLGGNTILGVSLAYCKLSAADLEEKIYEYVGKLFGNDKFSLPTPMMNIINGGRHAGNNLSFQEFLVVPINVRGSIYDKIEACCVTFYVLREILEKKYGKRATNVGDEGGFAPPMNEVEEALDILEESIESAGYSGEIRMSIDCAATSYYKDGMYFVNGVKMEVGEYYDYIREIIKDYNIFSIEDPFYEEDFKHFAQLTKDVGDRVLIIGDDLFTTNIERLREGIKVGACNAILIKPNQIGTLTETLEVMKLAVENGYKTVVSHRSGETNDNFIVHLAVGTGAPLIKAGAPCRGERVAKYNEMLRLHVLEGLE